MQELYDKLIQTPLSLVKASPRQTLALSERLTTLSEQQKSSNMWQVVTDSLTPPETAGIITTALTRALHALLQGDHHLHILIPEETVPSLTFPDATAYQNLTQHYSVGQRLTLSDLTRALVRSGYSRSRSVSETGEFRVRGEAIDITYSDKRTATLTFRGSTIENIVLTNGRRRFPARQLALPPLRFPKNSVRLEQLQQAFPWQHITLAPFALPVSSPAPSPVSRERALELLSSLQEGKYAVHADHGIGVYEGLHLKTIEHTEREYLVLQYAHGDILYVPVDFAHKVSAYLGEGTPRIHRLGGILWAKTKRRAQEEAAAFAKELLTVAGRRSLATRNPYRIFPTVEHQLAESFPFTLTPDQARTWQEVKHDLESSRPADRVVVGDVGFGKTEIAIRATRHVVENSKQVAIIAPTTLLVQQHADTFHTRLPELAHRMGMLSRFTPARAIRELRRQIHAGDVSIVIGTHALVSPHVQWKNLSLVIIDEEQKFGVRQKEYFKKLRATIDIISLSATPIPRTLAIALSHLADLSLIHTAPAGRRSVITHVALRQDEIIAQALNRELNRHGQVYVVASKIKHLSAIREHVQALVPRSRIALAHGRLPEKALAATMHEFDSGAIDILISSNIVESGLDLPNANTMIVWNATDFGLSDLYQLRGRIGRRERQGYTYFLYDQNELTSRQRQRLAALTEASRLGSGWSIARRDLEIRGAGNLLGREQSGTANDVGVQLYLDLVNHAVQDPSGGLDQPDTEIALPLPTLLPLSYIPNTSQRARIYQRLARAESPEQLASYQQQLERDYGPLPEASRNLLLILELQHIAQKIGIRKIDSKKITPPSQSPFYRVTLHGKTSTTLETPHITPLFIADLIRTLQ